jgi:hypothetical protein
MSLIRGTPDHVYWDGDYSRCHVGKDIEAYLESAVRKSSLPLSCIVVKSDGLIGQAEYDPLVRRSDLLRPESQYTGLELQKTPGTYPIVACLCSRGVDRSNLLHLPLDDDTFRLGLTRVLESVPRPAWEDRKPIAFWRGGASGAERPLLRLRVATHLATHPHADVKLTPWGNWEAGQDIPPELFGARCDLAECFRHKYLFIVDGNCIASNLQWVFGSGAVPLLVTHPKNRYWFQPFLTPMVDYVPIAYDLSDLTEKLDWLVAHDAEAKQIAEAALALSERVFSPAFQRTFIDDALATIVYGSPSRLVQMHLKTRQLPSDINEHLSTLYAYTKRCTSVVECGVREVVSSYSFAAGLVGTPGASYTLIDLYKSASMDPFLALCASEGIQAQFLLSSDTECEPIETDLLFIDTWHVYGHLKRELAHWHAHVRKYIALHDTTVDEVEGESIRMRLNIPEQCRTSGYPEEEIRKGLGPAIAEFLEAHPEWTVERKDTHNNGLTILARKERPTYESGAPQ